MNTDIFNWLSKWDEESRLTSAPLKSPLVLFQKFIFPKSLALTRTIGKTKFLCNKKLQKQIHLEKKRSAFNKTFHFKIFGWKLWENIRNQAFCQQLRSWRSWEKRKMWALICNHPHQKPALVSARLPSLCRVTEIVNVWFSHILKFNYAYKAFNYAKAKFY